MPNFSILKAKCRVLLTFPQPGSNRGDMYDHSYLSFIKLSNQYFLQGGQSMPEISVLLKPSQQNNRVREWLRATCEHATILSSTVAIMHPHMYHTGREALVHLGTWAASHGQADITDLLALWPLVYNVASIMANRASLLHMDQFGQPQRLDLLVTFGNYTNLHFLISSLHCQFFYEPGTLTVAQKTVPMFACFSLNAMVLNNP